MADMAALRRVRRQKLLQSSEERLQKIKHLNEKQQGSYGEAKEDAVMPAVKTPLASIDQVQSENAHEGDNFISTLPQQDSQAEQQIHCESAQESVDQSSDVQRVHSASDEQVDTTKTVLEESETNLHGDVECFESSDTAIQKVLQRTPTQPQSNDQVAETLASPNDSTASSPSLAVDSSQPAPDHQIQKSSSHNASPPTPSFEHIPLSSVDTSLTEQSQPQEVSQDVQDLSSVPQAGQVLMMRELVVVLVAILMRGLLLLHWFQSVSGQSVIIPFIALEVLFFCVHPQTLQPSSGVMVKVLSFAAMMCKIPQEVIHKVQLSLSIINTCCEDLALYFFVFILTHTVIEIFQVKDYLQ